MRFGCLCFTLLFALYVIAPFVNQFWLMSFGLSLSLVIPALIVCSLGYFLISVLLRKSLNKLKLVAFLLLSISCLPNIFSGFSNGYISFLAGLACSTPFLFKTTEYYYECFAKSLLLLSAGALIVILSDVNALLLMFNTDTRMAFGLSPISLSITAAFCFIVAIATSRTKLLLFLVPCFSFFVMVLTQSKGPILALGVTLVILMGAKRRYFSLLGGVSVAFFMISYIVLNRYNSGSSVSSRVLLLDEGLTLVDANPFGTFATLFFSEMTGHAFVHNIILGLWLNSNLLLVALMITMLITSVYLSVVIVRRCEINGCPPYSALPFLLFIFLFVTAMFSLPDTEVLRLLIPLFLMGCMETTPNRTRVDPVTYKEPSYES